MQHQPCKSGGGDRGGLAIATIFLYRFFSPSTRFQGKALHTKSFEVFILTTSSNIFFRKNCIKTIEF